MKHFVSLLLAFLATTAIAQQDQRLANGRWAYYGEEFYKALESGGPLDRNLLHEIFNEAHSSRPGEFDEISRQCLSGATCYYHTSVGYDRARKIMFGELDTVRDARGTFVVDVYCGKKFYFDNLNRVSNMHNLVNIEHTWPQSRFNGRFPKELQKSDMHHLYLTDSRANSTRGNSPFGFISSFDDGMGGEGCRNSHNVFKHHGRHVYTPPASHRGNVARALFYFSMHYDLEIGQSEERILRQWHKEDPVDSRELRRHEAIAHYQKVRNPFIDHPEIVDRILDF